MVKKARLEVAWDKMAYASFQQACDYIREESAVNAEKVRKEILKIIHSLPDHPEKYPSDKFKKDNQGHHRAFEKYSYRVAYMVTPTEIIILRIRHVKQEPKKY
jgi:plasmid stabilization system protein ParE